MNQSTANLDSSSRPPQWFWWISGLGLVWNLLGVAAFAMQMTMDLNQLPAAQREFFENTPVWATIGYAVSVFGGAIGCLALLLRKGWALLMLILCLVGIVVQIFHSMVVANGIEVFGSEGLFMPIAVFTIALFLTWFANRSKTNGWIT